MKGEYGWDLHAIQKMCHALVSNKQEGPVRCWLTYCSKPRACSCQQQPGRASQTLTYRLFKIQSMPLSTTGKKGQPDADLHTVQNPEHDLVSNRQEGQLNNNIQAVQNPEHALVSNNEKGPARCWLTHCWKRRTCPCQRQPERASQMLTYRLFKTQRMVLLGTTRKGQPDADLHTVQNPEHALVSNK